MFIEKIDSEHFACAEEPRTGVMTSTINASSFCNSPQSRQPVHSPGQLLPHWQSSFSSWSSASCSKQTKNHHNAVNESQSFFYSTERHPGETDGTAMGTVKPPYVGVRVKNPVKALILQANRNQGPSNYQNQDDMPCPELYPSITSKMPQTQNTVPISMTAAQMQGTSPQAVPHSNTGRPRATTTTETSLHAMYSSTHSGVPVATGNGLQISPFTPQPDLPLPSPPPRPLPCSAHSGISFFQWQIKQEEQKVARLALEQLVAQDSDGDMFLHISVAQGRRALSYALALKMAHLCMLDVKDYKGQSALHVSVAANQHLIVQDLITLGAQINTADCWGRSPLHVCAEKGHALSMQAIHRALGATGQKLNIEAVNFDGLTALHTAVLSHNAVCKDLEGETEQQSLQTQALLHRTKQLEECVRTLLQMGASCRTQDHKSGRTSLHMAAEEANVTLLRLFLDRSDSRSVINAETYTGNTALHVASALSGRASQADAVRLLMRMGADPSIRNLEKEQPSQLVPEGPAGDKVWRILKGKEEKSRPPLYYGIEPITTVS